MDTFDLKPLGGDPSADRWLLPSAALNRFEPPTGMLFEAGAAQEWTRYGYQIGTLSLLIGLATGSEVIPMPPLATIPNTPPGLRGMLNLRGNLVPVFDLLILLGLEEQEKTVKPMVLVLDQGDKAVGVIVDGFPQALSGMRKLQQLPQLPPKLEGCVPAGYVKEDMLWLEFDHESFFNMLVGTGVE